VNTSTSLPSEPAPAKPVIRWSYTARHGSSTDVLPALPTVPTQVTSSITEKSKPVQEGTAAPAPAAIATPASITRAGESDSDDAPLVRKKLNRTWDVFPPIKKGQRDALVPGGKKLTSQEAVVRAEEIKRLGIRIWNWLPLRIPAPSQDQLKEAARDGIRFIFHHWGPTLVEQDMQDNAIRIYFIETKNSKRLWVSHEWLEVVDFGLLALYWRGTHRVRPLVWIPDITSKYVFIFEPAEVIKNWIYLGYRDKIFMTLWEEKKEYFDEIAATRLAESFRSTASKSSGRTQRKVVNLVMDAHRETGTFDDILSAGANNLMSLSSPISPVSPVSPGPKTGIDLPLPTLSSVPPAHVSSLSHDISASQLAEIQSSSAGLVSAGTQVPSTMSTMMNMFQEMSKQNAMFMMQMQDRQEKFMEKMLQQSEKREQTMFEKLRERDEDFNKRIDNIGNTLNSLPQPLRPPSPLPSQQISPSESERSRAAATLAKIARTLPGLSAIPVPPPRTRSSTSRPSLATHLSSFSPPVTRHVVRPSIPWKNPVSVVERVTVIKDAPIQQLDMALRANITSIERHDPRFTIQMEKRLITHTIFLLKKIAYKKGTYCVMSSEEDRSLKSEKHSLLCLETLREEEKWVVLLYYARDIPKLRMKPNCPCARVFDATMTIENWLSLPTMRKFCLWADLKKNHEFHQYFLTQIYGNSVIHWWGESPEPSIEATAFNVNCIGVFNFSKRWVTAKTPAQRSKLLFDALADSGPWLREDNYAPVDPGTKCMKILPIPCVLISDLLSDVVEHILGKTSIPLATFEFGMSTGRGSSPVSTAYKQNFRPSIPLTLEGQPKYFPIRIIVPLCQKMQISVVAFGTTSVWQDAKKVTEDDDGKKRIMETVNVEYGQAVAIGPLCPYSILGWDPDVKCSAKYLSIWIHFVVHQGVRFETKYPNCFNAAALREGKTQHLPLWDCFVNLEESTTKENLYEWRTPSASVAKIIPEYFLRAPNVNS
jgi:hypothetical protein